MADGVLSEEGSCSHAWYFSRIGGFDQVRLHTGDDLKSLELLDQKLWAALSCPTHGLEFDSRTLELIDTDHDGRIRAPEIIAAVKWAISVLKNPADLMKGESDLPLSAIDDTKPEGKQLLASAKQILANLGKGEASAISTEDTSDTARIFAQTRFNGDSIVPPECTDDEATRSVIRDIMACMGPEADRSGLPGISLEKVERFFHEAEAFSQWWGKAEGEQSGTLLLFADHGGTTSSAFRSVRTKIDDYFMRCRLAAYDLHAAGELNPAREDYRLLSAKDLSVCTEAVSALPLAKIESGKPLPLTEGVNPAWADSVQKFHASVVSPLYGDKDRLTAEEWRELVARFRSYEDWLAAKQGTMVEGLGIERVREILQSDSREVITSLIEKDKVLEAEAQAITSVDKLIRFYRHLYTLLNNFVSFRDFYTPGCKAVFQVGSLYIDGRSCDLCIRVNDIAKHSSIAGLSYTFLAYCRCTRNGEEMHIAAAFTEGDADNLVVGRNGIFYDRKGRDWDANIVKIIEHPISIRQAFWSPYKRIARMVTEQVEKVAAAREKQVQTDASARVADMSSKAEAGKPAPSQPFDVAKFAGIFAAIGLAVGAIGTAIASVVTGFLGLRWWQMPLAFAGLTLIISGPSMALAYLHLRRRNLAPILDANGWAVNTKAMINIPFGNSLTCVARLPQGSRHSLTDPFGEKERRWIPYALILLFGLIAFFLLYFGLPAKWL